MVVLIMPSRNSLKKYVENGYYHVYNRGVEKRIIFEDEQDYKVFLRYLKEILSPVDSKDNIATLSVRGQSYEIPSRPLKNYNEEIDLLVYCLMPNHFHLIIKQNNKDSLQGFMRALMTRYSMYFNKKYNRVGSLFQGRYKAVNINNENYLLHLSRYIHLNPREFTKDIINTHSSYADYLGLRKTAWVKTDVILSFFNKNVGKNTYQHFVEKSAEDSWGIIEGLTLD